jgi:CHAT domain-containing protein
LPIQRVILLLILAVFAQPGCKTATQPRPTATVPVTPPSVAAAPKLVRLQGLFRVDKVRDDGHIELSVGSRHGLVMDNADHHLYLQRRYANGVLELDGSETLAWGRPVSVGPERTVLKLSGLGEPLPEAAVRGEGAALVLSWSVQVPPFLVTDPLARLLAMGLVLQDYQKHQPLVTLEALQRDPTPEGIAKVHEALAAEVRAAAPAAKEFFPSMRVPGPPTGAATNPAATDRRLGGKLLHEAMAETTAADIATFLRHAIAENAYFGARTNLLIDLYGRWLLAGAADAIDTEAEVRPVREAAKTAAANGDFDEAERQWLRVLQLRPRDSEAQGRRSLLARRRNLQVQLEAEPDRHQLRWSMVVTLQELGAYEAAIVELSLLKDSPEHAIRADRWRASLLRARGRWEEALALYESVWRRSGLESDERELTQSRVRRAVFGSADPHVYWQAAQVLWKAGNFTDSRSYYEEARRLSTDPERHKAALLGERRARRVLRAQDSMRETAKAVMDWRIVDAEGHFADGLRGLAETPAALTESVIPVFDALGNRILFEPMIRFARMYEQAAPRDVDALLHQAFAHKMMRRPEQALALLQRAEVLEPTSTIVFWLRVGLLLALGHTDEARAASQRHLQVDNRSTAALMLAARVAVAEGRYAEAVVRAERAYAKRHEYSSNDTNLLDRGYVEAAAEADRQLTRLRKKPPSDLEVQRWRATLAMALSDLELPQQAMAQARLLPKNGPWFAEVAETIGASSIVSATDAVFWLQQAVDERLSRQAGLGVAQALVAAHAAPQDLAAATRLAHAYVTSGLGDEARATLADVAGLADKAAEGPKAAWQRAHQRAKELVAVTHALQQARSAADGEDDEGALALATRALQQAIAGQFWPAAREAGIAAASSAELLGRPELARQHGEQALIAARRWGDEADLFSTEEVVAHVAARTGNLTAWPVALQRVRQRCLDRGRYNCVGGTERRLAELAQQEGKLAAAKAYIRAAMESAARAGAAKTLRSITSDAVEIFRQAGNLHEAIALATVQRDEASAAGASRQVHWALLQLAALHAALGDVDAAKRWFGEAEKAAGANKDASLALEIEAERGRWLLQGLGQPKQALPLLASAFRGHERAGRSRLMAEVGVLVAEAQLVLGLAAEASQTAAKAEQLALATGWMVPATQAARLLALSSPVLADAKAAAARAVERAQRQGWPAALALAWHASAMTKTRSGQGAESLNAFAQAVQWAVREAMGQTGASLGLGQRRERERLWADAVGTAVQANRPDLVLQWSALSRAVLSRQSRAVADSAADPQADAALQAYLGALQEERAAQQAAGTAGAEAEAEAWQGKAGSARNEAASALERIRRQHRRLFAQVAVEPETLTSLLPRLPAKTLVLQYFATADRLYIFAVGGPSATLRVTQVEIRWAEIERGIMRWRQHLLQGADRVALRGATALEDAVPLSEAPTVATEASELALAQPLYNWLLKPVEDELQAADTVLVLPFGALYYLPLHGLLHQTPAGLRYVLEDHRIGYLSGTTASAVGSKGPRPVQWRLLGVGNPDGTLPGARAELEQIRPLVGQDSVIWLDNAGKGKAFLQQAAQFDVLHLATHGVLRPDPADSHLKMADGPLTLVQIAGAEGLGKRPRLVVLSACSTALQPGQAPGDEVASLATAFAVAGVPSLLATLWDVDDAATAALMTGFYRELASGRSTLEALRQSQLALLEAGRKGHAGWASPAAWAALHLLGDPR